MTSHLLISLWVHLFLFTGFKSQSSHSYKPIANSRQNINSNRVSAKRNNTVSNKLSSHGMGTRSVSSGTLNQPVRISFIHYKNIKEILLKIVFISAERFRSGGSSQSWGNYETYHCLTKSNEWR